MDDALASLTEKEKETLRLVVRGHDAKSMARELHLSVHTINDRLRGARRKLEVTSSKEAARLLLQEEELPESLGHKRLGEDDRLPPADIPMVEERARSRVPKTGVIVAMLTLALAAALGLALADHPTNEPKVGDSATPIETVQLNRFEAISRDWLALVDAGNWGASFAAAGRSFRDPNTIAMWRAASQQARVPLGAMIEREALTIGFIQASENEARAESGESVKVRFGTRFENRSEAFETVTLEQEHGEWKVVGYVIE